MTDSARELDLRHYSAEPFTFDPTHEYAARPGAFKPPGFWLSVAGEDDWPAWCHGEDWGLDRLALEHKVTLKPSANVLHVADVDAFDLFDRSLPWGRHPTLGEYERNWAHIRAEFDGVTIAPYQWERRLEVMWYYGWDCASGVIWNLDAIEAVTLMAQVNPS